MKLCVALLCLSLALVSALPWGYTGRLQASNGTTTICNHGVRYKLTYNTLGVAEENMVDLDTLTGVSEIRCDIDSTEVEAVFGSEAEAEAYVSVFTLESQMFVTGGDKHGCAIPGTQSTLILRRVIASYSEGASLFIRTAIARYDDVYQDADIDMVTEGSCDGEWHVCVGANTDETCSHAAASLPLFSNEFVSLTCSDCFLSFTMDLNLSIKIKFFKLHSLLIGTTNTKVEGSMELDLLATANWGTGVEKTIPLVQHATAIKFKIGIVPFEIYFDVPLDVKLSAQFAATAEAIAGVNVAWTGLDYNLAFDTNSGWTHTTPSPQMTMTPKITGSASFDATADFSLIPSIHMHANQLFEHVLTLTPALHLHVYGSTEEKKVCESLTYDVDVVSQAELQIDINLLKIHKDWKWGPTSVWASGTQTVSEKCVEAAQELTMTDVVF